MLNYLLLKKNHYSYIFFLLLWSGTTLSQSINNFPCYISNGKSLFEFDPFDQQWTNKGAILFQGSTPAPHQMEAMAINPVKNILYVVDHNIFGTIDINTLVFTPLNSLGETRGFGEYGNQFFDEIRGMTYDPYKNDIWAIIRNTGITPGTEDFLIKINPETGQFIPKAFENNYDYVLIPGVYDGTLGRHVYDAEAIAINPYNQTLYTVQSQQGPGLISILNASNGEIESVIYDFDYFNVKGLTIAPNGMVLGVTNSIDFASLIGFDVPNGLDFIFGQLPTLNMPKNFESLVCNRGIFDLALKISLISSPIFSTGDDLTFEVEVINQGDIEVDYFTISFYYPISSNFEIKSEDWDEEGDNIIETEVSHTINPGESHKLSLTLELISSAKSQFNIAAEISEFQNKKIDEFNMQSSLLPDIDSSPDAFNNETNIMDDVIKMSGPKANEDEDDHDIVKLTLNLSCEESWYLTNNLICGAYYANQSIISNSQVLSLNNVQFVSGGIISLESGFSIDSNTSFEAEISTCP